MGTNKIQIHNPISKDDNNSIIDYANVWTNYINSIVNPTDDKLVRYMKINDAFYHDGIVKYPGKNGILEFTSKEKMVEFLLRWS